MLDIDDTIVAIASPTVPAMRGIVRLSGPRVIEVLETLGLAIRSRTTAHSLAAQLDVGHALGMIDARVLVWPTSRSYTGQAAAEFHAIGSLPILEAIVDAVIARGARAARPGEFTMRAFLAGRLDLTQAEAVLGVIDAEHRGSLDHALRQLAGNLSRPFEAMRSTMLDLLADVEAGLDFVDEDIEFISDESLFEQLREIAAQLIAAQHLLQERGGSSGPALITLRGEPNAGKSQLVNALAGSEVAIVADLAGTTRDVVTVNTELDGAAVTLVDTAGIEPGCIEAGGIEAGGDEAGGDDFRHETIAGQSQAHAQRASDSATIRVWCVDASRPDFDQACESLRAASRDARRSVMDLWVATKMDRAVPDRVTSPWIATSSQTGFGIGQLRRAISELIQSRNSEEVGSVIGTAARCRGTLQAAGAAIDAAIELTRQGDGHEFVAAELRTAVQCLGEVTGAVYTDDILDRVFGRFCIGK